MRPEFECFKGLVLRGATFRKRLVVVVYQVHTSSSQFQRLFLGARLPGMQQTKLYPLSTFSLNGHLQLVGKLDTVESFQNVQVRHAS